jgi:DNA-binding transcriptional MerR regulator
MERTWRIGEVAERTGLTRRTLRHYDELGLLVPSSRSWGDYRLYAEGDLLRLLQIQNLKALGLSLPEIVEALADPALDATTTLRSHLDHLEQRISAEQVLARHLHALADATDRSWEDVLAAVTLSQRLAHPDPTVRVRAALLSPGTSSSDLFSAFVGESDPGVREVLIWALAQRPEVGAAALARLDDPDPGLRAALVRLLAKLGDRSAVPALMERLADPEPLVAARAAQALGQLGDASAAPALIALLGKDTVPAADLVDAVAGLGSPVLDALAPALQSPVAAARAAAAEIVGRIGGADAASRCASALARMVDDPDPEVQLAAVLALGDLGTDGRRGLRRALADPTLRPVAERLLDLHVT